VWLVLGLAIYFIYGRSHSRLAQQEKEKEKTPVSAS